MGLLDRFSDRDTKLSKLESILENLNCVLNSKKGFGTMLQGFGIGDYNEYKGRDAIVRTLVKEIEHNINEYEPRVRVVEIREVESEMASRLRFEMRCEILNEDKPLFVNFDTANAKIEIEDL